MKRILVAMGILFTAVLGVAIGTLGYLGVMASQTADENKSAAVALVESVSETWSVDYSQSAFAPSAIAQASTPAGRRALAIMSRLGKLRSAHNTIQTGYKIDLETGTDVTVTFDGKFDFGSGAVTVVLRYIDDEARIVELDLKKIRLVRKRQRRVAV